MHGRSARETPLPQGPARRTGAFLPVTSGNMAGTAVPCRWLAIWLCGVLLAIAGGCAGFTSDREVFGVRGVAVKPVEAPASAQASASDRARSRPITLSDAGE